MQEHTNENLPSNLKVSRKGGFLVLNTRTATIKLDANRWQEIVAAITEVSQSK
ncbi:hypothetical protein [Neorhizobium sp. S3-V5DH]|uniref:hypothetical protein n=1 Tax=Neorhizobium sp. S3-V5DH TaxID=2485166 RepID=UPI0010EC2A1A|nr:hypothetical protein [Neorhizobium sp. S3-V5DH]TCV62323.1 hypothetical protein EDE09_12488 [Neorhizobium sp. S3-V5DH]